MFSLLFLACAKKRGKGKGEMLLRLSFPGLHDLRFERGRNEGKGKKKKKKKGGGKGPELELLPAPSTLLG